ncbi:MAG: hypothetical protein MRY21_03690 [Simkaniaceae bacterium]|nr:hypothetical protein [Simkaniaceae bacterium]
MQLTIEEKLLKNFPKTQIGYVIANIEIKESDENVEAMKRNLTLDLDCKTFTTHPSIAIWRDIYQNEFKVKPKQYRSSIEALVKRVVTGKSLWNINSIVDLYNCISLQTLLPMGGYDYDALDEHVCLRYAKPGDMFLALGEKLPIEVNQNAIVYADREKVICHLWNHKDAKSTSITLKTKRALFIIDGFDEMAIQTAIESLSDGLRLIGAIPHAHGILSRNCPDASCSF